MSVFRDLSLWGFLGLLALFVSFQNCKGIPEVQLQNDEAIGILRVLIADQVALIYQYSDTWDIPHYWPMNSPSGKNMLVQKVEPYPHHRSFWFADTIRFPGERDVSTYNALYSGEPTGEKTYGPPFQDRIRHLSFRRMESGPQKAVIESELIWEMDIDRPLLDEQRQVGVFALGRGEYLLDITFTLTASYGDIEFVSDSVHYAWPYLRLQTRFSGENGGIITANNGATGQENTNEKIALWIDYSNTLEGQTEGVAVFQWPDGQEHRWLTREYGCFGPRRPDQISGQPFVIRKGESLSQRVSVLVHRGDVNSGRVEERYQKYIAGHWRE